MEETLEFLRELKRHLNSIEHMLYVSCKFTRTVEMLRRVIENLVTGYEYFFSIAYKIMVDDDEKIIGESLGLHHKIQLLSDKLAERGIYVDLSDYFLLKKILLSNYEKIGEFRKNLCMISYIDGERYQINLEKLFDYYSNLREITTFMTNLSQNNKN